MVVSIPALLSAQQPSEPLVGQLVDCVPVQAL